MKCDYFPKRECPHALAYTSGGYSLSKSECVPCLLAELLKEIRKKKK